MTVKLSHERKVRSLAKKTFGSTRVGRAIRLPVIGSVVSGCRSVKSAHYTYREQSGVEVGWT